MRITLADNYRLPDGRAMAAVIARLLELQRREVIRYVRSGRRTPINMNGWIDYWTEKLLQYSLWHVAQGWKMQQARLAKVMPQKSWDGLLSKAAKTDEDKKDDKEKWLLLGLLGMMNQDIVREIHVGLRRAVSGIMATTSKWVNAVLARGEPLALVEQGVNKVFRRQGRPELIAGDEAVRGFHFGMVRVLLESKFRWMKTWRISDIEPEKTCNICLPLNGVTVPLDESFASWPASGSYTGMYTLVNAPPDPHVGCRCRIETFVDVDPAEVAYRREIIGV